MLPSPDILNDFQPGKFVLSNLAAKRAKQLREGAPPLVQIDSNHPLTIALAEIAAGKIKPIMPTGEVEALEIPETAVLVEETVPGELGMLLPALDETEAALVSGVVIGEDEHEHDLDEHEPDTLSLSDLVGEDEEHEEVIVPTEDDTLSLTDIAEQESHEEDEEPEE
ncbi:MAG TPA: DNA-directed RNA polymerase subunit omega [Fimbriimonadaceae bacterium]|nr:DNA-directed RNA polymerase subunit omega [Fimbriimonadaceae bacterium]